MLSEIKTTQSKSPYSGVLLPVLGIGAIFGAGYFGYKVWDKKREEKAIKEANESILKSTLSLKKRQENINRIESTKGFFSGVTANSPTKPVTVNMFDQAKNLIAEFYIKLTDKNGLDHYIKKSIDKVNQANVKSIYRNTPLNNINRLNKLYNIYTSKSFKEDSLKLSPNIQAEITAINNVAFKKFPDSFK